jgi:plastocyanin
MLGKNCQYRRTGTLAFIALFSGAGLEPSSAQTPSPLAGSFAELFPNPGGAAPIFTRPDVISWLPRFPLSPADVVEIRMQGSADGSQVWFDPIGVYVQPGQTIRWVNRDPVETHTTTAYHPTNRDHARRIPEGAEPWNSGYLQPNGTFSVRLTEEGVYDYFCIPHEKAGMVGRIVVGRPAGASEQSVGEVALGAGARAVPEPARRAFPSVEEIMRAGLIHPQTAGPSKGEAMGLPAAVHPNAEPPTPSRSTRRSLAGLKAKPPKGDGSLAPSGRRAEKRRRTLAGIRHGSEQTAGAVRQPPTTAPRVAPLVSARQHIQAKRQHAHATVLGRGRLVETTGSTPARARPRRPTRFLPAPGAPFVLPEVLRPREDL